MYRKRKGEVPPWVCAWNMAARPASVYSWHTRRTSSKSTWRDLLGVMATVLVELGLFQLKKTGIDRSRKPVKEDAFEDGKKREVDDS